MGERFLPKMLKNVSYLNVEEKERWEKETVPSLVAVAPQILPNNSQNHSQVYTQTHTALNCLLSD